MAKAKKQKTPVVKKEAMNKLVAFVGANQNAKKKLNAGQIREMIRLVYIGLTVAIKPDEVIEIHESFAADELVAETIKSNKIKNLKEKLAEAEKS